MTTQGWLFDMPKDRTAEVAEKRSQIASTLMKNMRLKREVDACYWALAFLRGGIDRSYIGRRCYGSSGEDNMSVRVIEMAAELARRPPKVELPYLQAVIAITRGPKWYDMPYRQYTMARLEIFRPGRLWKDESDDRVMQYGEQAILHQSFVDFFRAELELWYRKQNVPLTRKLLDAGLSSPVPEVRRLTKCMELHFWFHATRDAFVKWQMGWQLWNGVLPGVDEPIDLSGANDAIALAEERWSAEPMEPIPSWCLDGIHTSGDDPRFAGDVNGVRNMLAMFDRYGRLDPSDAGITVREGQGGKYRKAGWPVLVPSTTHPGKSYEIDFDGEALHCSCPGFYWSSKSGTGSCRHVRKFRADHPDYEQQLVMVQ
jgi:hypothetical protein